MSNQTVQEIWTKELNSVYNQALKFERSFGRSQWAGYIKHLISHNDVLKTIKNTPVEGHLVGIKIALGKITCSGDILKLIPKLEKIKAE